MINVVALSSVSECFSGPSMAREKLLKACKINEQQFAVRGDEKSFSTFVIAEADCRNLDGLRQKAKFVARVVRALYNSVNVRVDWQARGHTKTFDGRLTRILMSWMAFSVFLPFLSFCVNAAGQKDFSVETGKKKTRQPTETERGVILTWNFKQHTRRDFWILLLATIAFIRLLIG